MQQDILKSGQVSKIVFVYVDGLGIKKKEQVTLSYMDKKYCYFRTTNSNNFHKPKWRTKADITVYTPDGTYETRLIIRDTTYSQHEVLFEVDLPKTWNFKQMRIGTRKNVKLPVNITFSDNITIEANTDEMSIGGFSITSNHQLTTVQKGFPANCCMLFPKDLIINFPDGKLETDIKFVRQKAITDEYDYEGYHVMSFKFTSLTQDQKMILKTYLMKL